MLNRYTIKAFPLRRFALLSPGSEPSVLVYYTTRVAEYRNRTYMNWVAASHLTNRSTPLEGIARVALASSGSKPDMLSDTPYSL